MFVTDAAYRGRRLARCTASSSARPGPRRRWWSSPGLLDPRWVDRDRGRGGGRRLVRIPGQALKGRAAASKSDSRCLSWESCSRLVSAIAANVAFLCKHRGANAAPAVRFAHPLASARRAVRARGGGRSASPSAAVAWGLPRRGDRAGAALARAGRDGGRPGAARRSRRRCGFGSASAGASGRASRSAPAGSRCWPSPPTRRTIHSAYSLAALIAFEGGAVAIGADAAPAWLARARTSGRNGILLGVAAGVLIGVGERRDQGVERDGVRATCSRSSARGRAGRASSAVARVLRARPRPAARIARSR